MSREPDHERTDVVHGRRTVLDRHGCGAARLCSNRRGLALLPADNDAMGLALGEARGALETNDVPVGAVVLAADGTVLGAGRNERERTGDPTAHAEVLALRAAAAVLGRWNLAGCTLVVTLEPCTMCAGALLAARVTRLVFGAWDAKAGAAGSVRDVVRDARLPHRVEVVAGVREEECSQLLLDFFLPRRKQIH